MRTAILAVALLMSGAAVAQTTTTTQPDVDVDADVGVQPDGDLDVDADVDVGTKATATGTATTMHTSHAAPGTAIGGQLVQPGNTNPERDARGIAVISAPAVAPIGWNGAAGASVGGPLVDPATGQTVGAEATYPVCSATVTDNCVQAYERGRIPR